MGIEDETYRHKKPDGSGRIAHSGFRYNIARECRWSKETVKGLPTFRENFDKIDWSKKDNNEEQKK